MTVELIRLFQTRLKNVAKKYWLVTSYSNAKIIFYNEYEICTKQ